MHDVALQEPHAPVTEQRLLAEYVRTRSQQAFAELVGRYSGLVYSAALRQVRDPHLADDVTQAAFLLLAQKAASLPEGTVLGGWLYNTARFVAGNVVKKEARRRKHEPAAAAARYLDTQREDTFVHDVLPLLDAAMAELPDRDRDALVLRYFEHMTMAQVGQALAISSHAAEKRVVRGLDKLRGLLARRGVVAAAAPLATLLTTEAVRAAPAALVQSMQAGGITSLAISNSAPTGAAGSNAAPWTLLVSPKTLVGTLTLLIIAVTGAAYVAHRLKPAPVAVVAPPPGVPAMLSLGNGITLPLVPIPAGGAVATPFLIGKFEVTQAQWSAVMGTNPSAFPGGDRPVEGVTWAEARTFCENVSALTGFNVRLPTEAEWEHACRAGTTTRYFFGDDPAMLSQYAWHGVQEPGDGPATRPIQRGAFTTGGSGRTTHSVGTKLPNPWGLHDMYGNVWEWCDTIAPPQRAANAATPASAPSGWMNVRRGGSWHNSMPQEFRSNYRWLSTEGLRQNNVGLRVAVEVH